MPERLLRQLTMALGPRNGRGAAVRHPGRIGTLIVASLLVGLAPAAARSQQRETQVTAFHGEAALSQARRAGIDIAGIIETVDHHLAPVAARPGLLRVDDRLYRADIGAKGIALSLRMRLSKRELAMREKAWRVTHRFEPGRRGRSASASLPAQAIPFQRQAAFRIEVSALRRGGKALSLAPAGWRSQRNETQRLLASGLRERVRAREGRLEWDFVVTHPLPGSGALEVEANVDAVPTPEQERHGWRWTFADGRRVRIGELRVEDARGTSLYTASPSVSHGQLLLSVPASVLARATYPLILDPEISPEYPLSEPVISRHPRRGTPAIAFDGTNYLLVWADHRVRFSSTLYGARLTQGGVLLDPDGIAIADNPIDLLHSPSLAFDGTNYLVVFDGGCARLCGARVTPTGSVLDPEGIAISTAPNPEAPAVAFDGTNYFVAWDDTRAGPCCHIFGARVTPGGTVLDPSGVAISTAPEEQIDPTISFDGTNYLVAWEDFRSGSYDNSDVYGTRVSPAGVVLDPAGLAISTAAGRQDAPALAFDGTNYLVVWQDLRSEPSYDIYGARVSPAGSVLDGGGLAISTAANSQYSPALAFDGANYLVAWEDFRSGSYDNSDVYGTRVNPAGVVLDPAGLVISTAIGRQDAPTISFDGTNYLLAWSDSRVGVCCDIYGARVSPAGSVLDADAIAVSTAVADSQYSPALAFDGTNYLAVWTDERPSAQVYGARVSPDGTLLDPAGIAIATSAPWHGLPTLVFGGTNYLVVWEQGAEDPHDTDFRAARVSRAGAVLDPSGIQIARVGIAGGEPAVAFDGTNYLVVWGGFRNLTIDAARLTLDGDVLDPDGFTIWHGDCCRAASASPALAWDGTNYLVVWAFFGGLHYQPGVYGGRVTPGGGVLDPTGIAISTGTGRTEPALAFDGTNYVVAWADFRSGAGYDIYGARVSPAGAVLNPDGIAISAASGDQHSPGVAFEGRNSVVLWSDHRSGARSDIYGARVSPAGAVLDTDGLAIATTADDESAPALAAGPPGQLATSYERIAGEPPYDGVGRIFLRLLQTRPANDDWSYAEDLGRGSSSRSATTVDATGEPGEPDHDRRSRPLNSVWYSFTLPATAIVQLDTCGSSLDTVLAVYTGASVGALTEVAAHNNGCGHQSRVVFRGLAGVRYTVAVDGAGAATGTFTLTFTARR
jgi:hypothetical protein